MSLKNVGQNPNFFYGSREKFKEGMLFTPLAVNQLLPW
jgi:hypothetical protein